MFDGESDYTLRRVPDVIAQQSIMLHSCRSWLVGVPMTPEAAGWWGFFTDWCTARDVSAFSIYHRQGPLIVFQHRSASWRWQLHPATGEFRDMQNRGASWKGFLGRHPEVAAALAKAFVRGVWG